MGLGCGLLRRLNPIDGWDQRGLQQLEIRCPPLCHVNVIAANDNGWQLYPKHHFFVGGGKDRLMRGLLGAVAPACELPFPAQEIKAVGITFKKPLRPRADDDSAVFDCLCGWSTRWLVLGTKPPYQNPQWMKPTSVLVENGVTCGARLMQTANW